jgi:hypothetical protein
VLGVRARRPRASIDLTGQLTLRAAALTARARVRGSSIGADAHRRAMARPRRLFGPSSELAWGRGASRSA